MMVKYNPQGFKLQGEFDFKDLHIMVENKKGSVRRGTDPDGKEWETKMLIPYGYISRTVGADKDHVDCFVGDNRDSDKVFVVHQVDPNTGKFDEDKVMLGFDTAKDAKTMYLKHYDSPKFFGSMTEMAMDELKELLKKKKGESLKKALLILNDMSEELTKNKLHKALVGMSDLTKSIFNIEEPDLLKARGVPVGTVKTHSDGITRIKTENGWRPHNASGGHGSSNRSEESTDGSHGPITTLLREVSRLQLSSGEKVDRLLESGVTDPQAIVDATRADRSLIVKRMLDRGIEIKEQRYDADALRGELEKVPVKERWDSYRLFLDMVANNITKSAIAYGTGGVGKTFNLKKVFDENGLEEFKEGHLPGGEAYDYVKITGKSTPAAMYRALYEHNGKIVVFDDCDSVLKDETSINILKGALDTTGDGTVSYLSGRPLQDSGGSPLPQRFAFTGRAVFVSNLKSDEMPQPLRSRSMTIDLTMTADETIEIMRDIIHVMPFQNSKGEPIEVSKTDRQAAIDFLAEVANKIPIGDLNARTLGQIALIKKRVGESGSSLNWKTAATAMLT